MKLIIQKQLEISKRKEELTLLDGWEGDVNEL
jgi:hypothetical protein